MVSERVLFLENLIGQDMKGTIVIRFNKTLFIVSIRQSSELWLTTTSKSHANSIVHFVNLSILSDFPQSFAGSVQRGEQKRKEGKRREKEGREALNFSSSYVLSRELVTG